MANQAYLNGDFWLAIDDVAAGESPATTPAKWRRMEIPAVFERCLVIAAAVACEPHRGQHEKGALLARAAQEALDDAIVDEARTHGRSHQPVVFTR